ncbi:MAG: hypothetical protein WAM44_07050, partial [Chthoniobacterales bacterium]
LLRMTLLALAGVTCLAGQKVYATAQPDIFGILSPGLLDSKTIVGPDGNMRVIWDYDAWDGILSYFTGPGSALWILDPSGNLLATANIPGGGGEVTNSRYGLLLWEIPVAPGFATSKSNILVQGYADGNTLVVVIVGNVGFIGDPTFPPLATSFGTLTYNSAGQLIAYNVNGPFLAGIINNIYFDTSGALVVKYKYAVSGPAAQVVQTLNEFGAVTTSEGPYGPYAFTGLGKVAINSSGNQVWFWSTHSVPAKTPTTTNSLSIWTFNSSGLATATAYGPF